LTGFRHVKEKYTSANIKAHLKHELDFYGITDNIVSITTDNASDMKKATTDTGFGLRFGSFTHILNLILVNGLNFRKRKQSTGFMDVDLNDSNDDIEDENESIHSFDEFSEQQATVIDEDEDEEG
jgi:hypothetical protein